MPSLTLDEVAKHNSQGDCWIVLHGQVYDVSDWLDYHPGGVDVLLSVGGTDATSSFEAIGHPDGVVEANSLFVKHLGPLGSGDSGAAAFVQAPQVSSICITEAEVAQHNTKDDCWIILNGQVYDVTDWLDYHPGGVDILLSVGGTDATSSFEAIGHPDGVVEANSTFVKHLGPLGSAEGGVPQAAAPQVAVAAGAWGVTKEEVAKHRTREDCWMIINGKVYDVTRLLPMHPGGDLALMTFAGADASSEFNLLHEDEVWTRMAAFLEFKGPLVASSDNAPQAITKEEVAKHRTREDCWMIINGNVYDVTKLLPMHPGGDLALMTFAGADASTEFNMIHEKDVWQRLAPFYSLLGPLAGAAPAKPAAAAAAAAPANGVTKEEVAKHRTKEDCWIIINGKAYDVTKMLPIHPGGELAIMTFAGADATAEFNTFHEKDVLQKFAAFYEVKGPIVAASANPAAIGAAATKMSPGYTMEEVAKHNKESDAWVVVRGKVLDVTKFLSEHPGGKEALLGMLGKDVTNTFNMIHADTTFDSVAMGLVIADVSVPITTAAPAGSAVKSNLAAPLLSKGDPMADEHWWGDARNTRGAAGAFGPAFGAYVSTVWSLILMVLWEVCATIFTTKNIKINFTDKSGLTRSALFMAVFVLIHGLGNLHLFAGPDHFNGYAYFLNRPVAWGTLFLPVELYLLAAGMMHASIGIARTYQYKNFAMLQTRSVLYRGPTHSSGLDQVWMAVSGGVVLMFLVIHLMHFRFASESSYDMYTFRARWMYPFVCASDDTSCQLVQFKDLYKMEYELFQSFWWVVFYCGSVGFFVSHMQTGLHKVVNSHASVPRAQKWHARVIATFMSVFIGLCYFAYPVYCYLFPVRDWKAYAAAQPHFPH